MRKPSHSHAAHVRRKTDVQQDQIRRFLARGGDRFRAVQRRDHLITRALQFQGDGFDDNFVVIHDQNFFCWLPFRRSYQIDSTMICPSLNYQCTPNLAKPSACAKQNFCGFDFSTRRLC